MTVAVGSDLTARETDVMRGVAAGKTYKGIAEDMGVKPETVKAALVLIRRKLGIRPKAALAVWAVKHIEGL